MERMCLTIGIQWTKLWKIAKCAHLFDKTFAFGICAYYVLGFFNAFIDGVSAVFLAEIITGRSDSSQFLSGSAVGLFPINMGFDYTNKYFLVIALLLLKALFTMGSMALEGIFDANIRRRIQESGFTSVLEGDWEYLRDIQVGKKVGAVTQEASSIASMYGSIIKAAYGLLNAIFLVAVALAVNTELTLLFAIVGVPSLLILKYLFKKQGTIVEDLVSARQGYYSSVTEYFSNLFQIKVQGNIKYFSKRGLEFQGPLTRLELQYWFVRAVIMALNLLLPAFLLIAFYLWARFHGYPLSDFVYLLAGIGLIGTRILAQVNLVTSNVANISAFSGSILPVYELFAVPHDREKKVIPEKIVGVQLEGVAYHYALDSGIENISMKVEIGTPLLLLGPSGSGKTTISNIIAGIYHPAAGTAFYKGASGMQYGSLEYRPRVGYVTQDIQLFRGSVRENLSSSVELMNDAIWEALDKVGASEFVRKKGGLDAEISEAGRSLSGGERRRLGIARALTQNPDILILDEMTVGLDELRKKELIDTINVLAKSLIVIVVTHDDIELDHNVIYQMAPHDEPA